MMGMVEDIITTLIITDITDTSDITKDITTSDITKGKMEKRPKLFLAYMCVLGSLFWFAMMSLTNLTTQRASVFFCLPFLIALGVGIYGLCYLALHTIAPEKDKAKE
jgi:hypothetical protein